ncbi:MAG: MaoC family dehydratase [Gammaproteobacteria bacterium]
MNDLNGYCLDDLEIGMSACYSRTITDADVVNFAGVSGDTNPIHLDEQFASSTHFKTRIAHVMNYASYLYTILGTKLPGPGSIYINQQMQFCAPVKVGETVVARVQVKEIDNKTARVILDTTCTVGSREVIRGTAELLVPRRRHRYSDRRC